MGPRTRNKNHTINGGACWDVVVYLHRVCLTGSLSFALTLTLAWSTQTDSRTWSLVTMGTLVPWSCLLAWCIYLISWCLRAIRLLKLWLVWRHIQWSSIDKSVLASVDFGKNLNCLDHYYFGYQTLHWVLRMIAAAEVGSSSYDGPGGHSGRPIQTKSSTIWRLTASGAATTRLAWCLPTPPLGHLSAAPQITCLGTLNIPGLDISLY